MMAGLTSAQKYLFDLNGFIILRNVFTAEEVAGFNKALTSHMDEFKERLGGLRNSKNEVFTGDKKSGRLDLGRFLLWPGEEGAQFRRILDHQKLVPVLNDLVSPGYRLDHLPLAIVQRPGVEGFDFHGGAVDSAGVWRRDLAYFYERGQIHNSLLAMSVQLSPTKAGDGGFVAIPGSHKSNEPIPQEFMTLENSEFASYVQQPAMNPGDVVLFSEATAHGALPWKGNDERRILLFRFSPYNMAYGRGYLYEFAGEGSTRLDAVEWTDGQRAVLEPPYHIRLNRSELSSENAQPVIPAPRSQEKLDFDRSVFGHDYF